MISSCSAWLLFTSQRSGSTWTCQVLNAQPGVACGLPATTPAGVLGELMEWLSPEPLRRRKRTQADVTWAEWQTEAEGAFAALRKKQGCHGGGAGDQQRAIGFQLMYDQVPPQHTGRFLEYVASRNITVLHLVREATVLRLASHMQTHSPRWHTADKAEAMRLREAPTMRWGAGSRGVRAVCRNGPRLRPREL